MLNIIVIINDIRMYLPYLQSADNSQNFVIMSQGCLQIITKKSLKMY
jgi:hypothetical protein